MRSPGCAWWLLPALAVAGSCGNSSETTPAAAPPPASVPVASTGAVRAYPALYSSMSLPQIEGGVVLTAGRQSTSLADGLALTVTSSKTVDEARAYYSGAMTALGWTALPAGRGASVPNLPVASVSFSKDQTTYSATITVVPTGGTRIEIRVIGQ